MIIDTLGYAELTTDDMELTGYESPIHVDHMRVRDIEHRLAVSAEFMRSHGLQEGPLGQREKNYQRLGRHLMAQIIEFRAEEHTQHGA